jgi:hypothetical protein
VLVIVLVGVVMPFMLVGMRRLRCLVIGGRVEGVGRTQDFAFQAPLSAAQNCLRRHGADSTVSLGEFLISW